MESELIKSSHGIQTIFFCVDISLADLVATTVHNIAIRLSHIIRIIDIEVFIFIGFLMGGLHISFDDGILAENFEFALIVFAEEAFMQDVHCIASGRTFEVFTFRRH